MEHINELPTSDIVVIGWLVQNQLTWAARDYIYCLLLKSSIAVPHKHVCWSLLHSLFKCFKS